MMRASFFSALRMGYISTVHRADGPTLLWENYKPSQRHDDQNQHATLVRTPRWKRVTLRIAHNMAATDRSSNVLHETRETSGSVSAHRIPATSATGIHTALSYLRYGSSSVRRFIPLKPSEVPYVDFFRRWLFSPFRLPQCSRVSYCEKATMPGYSTQFLTGSGASYVDGTNVHDTGKTEDSTTAKIDQGVSQFPLHTYAEDRTNLVVQCCYGVRAMLKTVQLVLLSIPVMALACVWVVLRSAARVVQFMSSGQENDSTSLGRGSAMKVIYWLENGVLDILWDYLYWAVKKAGPTYIKLIQWIGTRADIFPPTICFRSARFHCDAPAHPYPYTELKLEKALKTRGVSSMIWVDPTPIGVGCVGQVHRGILKEKEECYHAVAVKVLHPGIRAAIVIDLTLLRAIATVIDIIPGLSWLAVRRSAEQFAELMLSQLDLFKEGDNLVQFGKNFSTKQSRRRMAKQRGRIVVPKVFFDYSTSEVLVESFEEGMLLGEWMLLTSLPSTEVSVPNTINATDFSATQVMPTEWTSRGHFLQYLEEEGVGNELAAIGQQRLLQTDSPGSNSRDRAIDSVLFWIRRMRWMLRCGLSATCSITEDTYTHLRRQCTSILGDVWESVSTVFPFLQRFSSKESSREANVTLSFLTREYKAYARLVGDVGLRLFLQMVFVDNFVHADLHPGNLMIRFSPPKGLQYKRSAFSQLTSQELENHLDQFYPSSVLDKAGVNYIDRSSPCRPPPPPPPPPCTSDFTSKNVHSSHLFSDHVKGVDFELVLLDCGLTTSLASRDYSNLIDVLCCLCAQDGYAAGKLIVERAQRQACFDADGFCRRVDELLKRYCASVSEGTKLRHIRIGEYLARMLAIACYYRVELDPCFVSLILAVVVSEGVGRQLNPDIDIAVSAVPYIKDAALGIIGRHRAL